MEFWDHFTRDRLTIAHRGYRAIRAENTMAAFKAAIDRYDFIELDVGFSRDGVPIVIHDDTLERTSNAIEAVGFEAPYRVADYSYKELLELDFSTWFMDRDPFGTIADGTVRRDELKSFTVEKIPTLAEVLNFLKINKMPVNIEIKDMRGTPFDSVAVQKTLSVISAVGMEEYVLLSSFNHSYLSEAKLINPNICRAALFEDSYPDNLIEYLRELDVSCCHPRANITTKELVEELNRSGFIVNVFTVNDHEEKRKMYEYGVRSIFTDFL